MYLDQGIAWSSTNRPGSWVYSIAGSRFSGVGKCGTRIHERDLPLWLAAWIGEEAVAIEYRLDRSRAP